MKSNTAVPCASLGVLSCLIIVGCGSPGSAPSARAALPAAQSTTKTATTNQWASLVAQQRKELEEAKEPWDERSCSSLSLEDPFCAATLITLQYTVQITGSVFDAARNPSVQKYLGEPPVEIQDLVTQTAQAAAEAANLAEAKGSRKMAGAFQFERAVNELQTVYAGWAPYL